MRATDLLGRRVRTRDGRRLGAVRDLHLARRRGSLRDSGVPAYHVTAIECGPVGVPHRLGYTRKDVAGPWPLHGLLAWFARRSWIVRWDQIASVDEDRIVLAVDREQLRHLRRAQP